MRQPSQPASDLLWLDSFIEFSDEKGSVMAEAQDETIHLGTEQGPGK